jgi:Lrp/AsnC family transcriptional regulator, leucine-responsive regulatory protein
MSDTTPEPDRQTSRSQLQKDLTGEFDDIDRKLLTSLQENDRLPLAELGKSIGVAHLDAQRSPAAPHAAGGHRWLQCRLSMEALGLNLLAFVYVAWSDPKTETAFRERIFMTASVLECHHVTGEWNYLVKVRVRTTRDLEAFLADIKSIEGVQRTETVIVLSSLRETLAVDVNL